MADLDELYQSVILDHNKTPRNFRRLDGATCEAEGRNPMCGDHFTIWLKVEDDAVVDAAFLGAGCAISKASASLMTSAIKGRRLAEVHAMFESFHQLVTRPHGSDLPLEPTTPLPPQMDAFRGVSEFPMRVKCATLSWHAMKSALHRAAQD